MNAGLRGSLSAYNKSRQQTNQKNWIAVSRFILVMAILGTVRVEFVVMLRSVTHCCLRSVKVAAFCPPLCQLNIHKRLYAVSNVHKSKRAQIIEAITIYKDFEPYSKMLLGDQPIKACNPITAYLKLVQQNEALPNPHQLQAILKLNEIHNLLSTYEPIPRSSKCPLFNISPRRWLYKTLPRSGPLSSLLPKSIRTNLSSISSPPQGLYMYGGVGCGKTMTMDLFFKHAPVKRKVRAHFHPFMLDVHKKIHKFRKLHPHSNIDPVVAVAHYMVKRLGWLICIDEFQVTDIADAMIMKRLFSAMFEAGCVMVCTSNRPPDNLYQGGVNRYNFLPFIPVLKQHSPPFHLSSKQDYRLVGETAAHMCFHPINDKSMRLLQDRFSILSGVSLADACSSEIEVMYGRKLIIPKTANGVCMFTFKQLCETSLGPSDYLALANTHNTVILSGISSLDKSRRESMRRFITLVDILYEHRIMLVYSAAKPVEHLYHTRGIRKHTVSGTNRTQREDEVFAWERTVSRLTEMRSALYVTNSTFTEQRRQKDRQRERVREQCN